MKLIAGLRVQSNSFLWRVLNERFRFVADSDSYMTLDARFGGRWQQLTLKRDRPRAGRATRWWLLGLAIGPVTVTVLRRPQPFLDKEEPMATTRPVPNVCESSARRSSCTASAACAATESPCKKC